MPLNIAVNIGASYDGDDDAVHANRVSALNLIHQLLDLRNVSEKHKKEQLSIGLWKWTEAEGVAPHAKYHTRLRSTGALDIDRPAKVNHEHVWPRKWLIQQLLGRADWSRDHLWNFLTEFGVACIVTVGEHAALSAVTGAGWERYERAGIEVRDMGTNRPFVFPHLALATSGVSRDVPEVEPVDRPADVPEEGPGHAELPTVEEAITLRAGVRADAFRKLLGRLDSEEIAVAVGVKQDGRVGDYLRIHDNALSEPSAAVAYLHWSGKLSLRLLANDVPDYLLRSADVAQVAHSTYGVRYKVADEGSIDVAEALIELALEKVRAL